MGIVTVSVAIAKLIKCRECTRGTDLKNCAGSVWPTATRQSPTDSRPVEVTIAALHEPKWRVRPIASLERVKNCQIAARTHLEDRSTPFRATRCSRPAVVGCPVKIAIGSLDKLRPWPSPIEGIAAKDVQNRPITAWGEPENLTIIVDSSLNGCAIEITILSLH